MIVTASGPARRAGTGAAPFTALDKVVAEAGLRVTDYTKIEPTGPSGEPARLGHGQFFGCFRRECDVEGLSVALVRADARKQVQQHTHASAHFIGVLGGLYVSSARGADTPAGRPLVVFNPAGTRHRDHFAGDPGDIKGHFVSVSLSDARLASISEHALLTAQATAVRTGHAALLLHGLVRELGDWEEGSALVVESLCLELAGCVARRDAASSGEAPSWLRLAEALLREEGRRHTSVTDVARLCGVHPVHLARVFRRHLSCSPGAFARRCRAERAAELLVRGDSSLSSIARAAGFVDQSHLSREFKRYHGTTPSQYRARQRR